MLMNALPTTPVILEAEPVTSATASAEQFATETRATMVAKHLPLVRYVASSMTRHAGASSIIDYDDLVGYGSEGLIEAVDTFDPTYNVKFSTWAVMHIRTTIQDALRTLDPLPRSLRSKGKEIERVSYDLANRNGYWPHDTEVAAELGVPLQRLRTTMQDIHKVVVSLNNVDDAHGEETGYSWAASLADDDPDGDPEAALDNAETSVLLMEAVDLLPEREQRVVVAYYRQNRSMRDIADELGVSESRISQLHARALKLLRSHVFASVEDAPRVRVA